MSYHKRQVAFTTYREASFIGCDGCGAEAEPKNNYEYPDGWAYARRDGVEVNACPACVSDVAKWMSKFAKEPKNGD